MARGKWWEPDLLQGDRDIDEIKAEFEENGFTNLTQKEIKRFHSYNRKEQKRLMAMPMKEVNQQAIAEQKAFNLLWGYEKNAGFAMISFAVLLSLGAYAR
jgi:hypothetical protein